MTATAIVDAVEADSFEDQRYRFQQLRTEKKLRHRDAAREMGLSEAEAIALHVGHRGALSATRLQSGEFPQLITALTPVGTLMALTRNEAVVHERTGTYVDASVNGHVGLVLGEDIDLRIFYNQWHHGFWVEEQVADSVNRSLQFFDEYGGAVHKIFERKTTDTAMFERVARSFSADDQRSGVVVTPYTVQKPNVEKNNVVDVDLFRAAWAAMQDTHEFFGLLKKFGLSRTRAFTQRVSNATTRYVLQQASERLLEIMVFVPSPGCIQIHTGLVSNIQVMGTWLNVLDPDFNLHLREDLIAESWVVRKPTADGVVTSLEIFDADGNTIAYFFGKRKPGIPELEAWRELIDDALLSDTVNS
jgi:putative hemin transport protein